METSASFEARYAPLSYPTAGGDQQWSSLPQHLTSCFQCQPRLQRLVDAVRAWQPAPLLFTFAQSCETHLGKLRMPALRQ